MINSAAAPDSLLITQAIAKLETRTGKRISPRTFIFQTLEQIARERWLSAPAGLA